MFTWWMPHNCCVSVHLYTWKMLGSKCCSHTFDKKACSYEPTRKPPTPCNVTCCCIHVTQSKECPHQPIPKPRTPDTPKAPTPRNNVAGSATTVRSPRNTGSGMCLVKTCNCRTQLTSRKNNGRRKTLFLNVSCDAFVFVELCFKRFAGAVPALDSVTNQKSDKQKLKSTGRKADGMPPKASVLH